MVPKVTSDRKVEPAERPAKSDLTGENRAAIPVTPVILAGPVCGAEAGLAAVSALRAPDARRLDASGRVR